MDIEYCVFQVRTQVMLLYVSIANFNTHQSWTGFWYASQQSRYRVVDIIILLRSIRFFFYFSPTFFTNTDLYCIDAFLFKCQSMFCSEMQGNG